MLGPGGLEALDSDETEDDEEFKNDPVYQMDVKVSDISLDLPKEQAF